jgi:hypothetical protein
MDSNPINDAHFILAQILNHPDQITDQEKQALLLRAIGRLTTAERTLNTEILRREFGLEAWHNGL